MADTTMEKRRSPWRVAQPLVVMLIFVAAAWLLYRELKSYNFGEIRRSVRAIPAVRLWVAAGLTALNYLILIGYDYLAVRWVRHPLPLWRISLASFIGFVTSYNFGAALGGTSVRFRLYSAWGLSAVDIVRLMLMMGLTFWFGIFALAGVIFVVEPFAIPAELSLPWRTVRPLGFLLLALAVGYVAVTGCWKKPIRIRGEHVTLPGPAISLLQLSIAAADLIVAAACLYVLLPADIGLTYFEFLGIYLLAVVAVIFSHVPGGVGVFELMVLKLAGAQSSEAVVAALLVFRVIYYLLPLLIAATLFAGHEISLRFRPRKS